jgi:hypothetical protein
MTRTCEARPRGVAAGLWNASLQGSFDSPSHKPIPATAQAQNAWHRPLSSPRYELAFRRHVEAAWLLGPAPLACLLEEVLDGADLRAAVARYAALDRDFIVACNGDRFPTPIFTIEGGRR